MKLAAEYRTENGTVFIDETTELLMKLQRPLSSATTSTATGKTGGLTEFLKNDDHHSTSDWLQRVRAMIIRSDQIYVSDGS